MNTVTKQPLTSQELAELANLAAMPDEHIDYSDIPPTSPEQWQDAKRGAFYRPVKQQLTLRLDADVIDWFKNQGKGYQARINALLRQAMMDEIGRMGH